MEPKPPRKRRLPEESGKAGRASARRVRQVDAVARRSLQETAAATGVSEGRTDASFFISLRRKRLRGWCNQSRDRSGAGPACPRWVEPTGDRTSTPKGRSACGTMRVANCSRPNWLTASAKVQSAMTPRPFRSRHPEKHLTGRAGWLRASVMGANDGIVSTASLVLGVAAAGASSGAVITAGIAGLVAGALSMAAGEYVSVASQRDAEEADLDLERRELVASPSEELTELSLIYEGRGLSPELARQVARELTDHDALEAHARDELGLDELSRADPFQAAWTSAVSFSVGAALPLIAISLPGEVVRIALTVVVALAALAGLGAVGARLGRAPIPRAAARVFVWGALAMALTYAIGYAVGTMGL